jgi:outer membrane protein
LASAEAGLALADSELQIARAAYKRLVGRVPVDLQAVPQFVLPATADEALRLARENNPQLIASYFSEQAGKSAIDVAKAAGRPKLSLSGSVGAQRGQLFGFEEAETASLTANISIPIFSGGMNSSRVRQAKHAKTRLAFESRDREREIDETVIRAWSQKEAAASTLIAIRKQVEAAELAFEGVTLEQQVGTRTQLDVLDAEQEVLNAELALVNANRNLNAARYQLLATIGVFDAQGINLQIETPYDPKANFEAVRYDGLSNLVDTTIAEPVQSLARTVSGAVSDGFDGIAQTMSEPIVKDTAKAVPEAARKVFEQGKAALDKVSGVESDFHPLVNEKQPKIETEPYGDEAGQIKVIETHRND